MENLPIKEIYQTSKNFMYQNYLFLILVFLILIFLILVKLLVNLFFIIHSEYFLILNLENPIYNLVKTDEKVTLKNQVSTKLCKSAFY